MGGRWQPEEAVVLARRLARPVQPPALILSLIDIAVGRLCLVATAGGDKAEQAFLLANFFI